jgi:hypothetical protein
VSSTEHPFSLTPTVDEQAAGITASNPYGDLAEHAIAPGALNGWQALQTAVNTTLHEQLGLSQTRRSRVWETLARG